MNRCETITLLDIPQQQPRQAEPFTTADLRALLHRHREELATRMLALFRKAGWPVPRAELLRVLAADEDEVIRAVLAVSAYVPEDRRRLLDETTDGRDTPATPQKERTGP